MFQDAPGGRPHGTNLPAALDEEEQELWRQLRRKRDFEGRVAEKRAQLAELRDRRRAVSTAHAEARASVEQLAGELSFAEEQRREIEHDIAVLKESNRLLQQAYYDQQHQHPQQQQQQQQQPRGRAPPAPMHGDADAHDILTEEKRRQEAVLLQHEQIAHLRSHIEKLRAEKGNLTHRQQVLFEKQRSAEQDRNRLLGTLQDERSAINEVRQERIKLWEERTKLEREMAQIVQGASGATDALGAFSPPPTVPGASGGVRGHVTRDTPQAFADTTNMSGTSPPNSSGLPRTGWTGFAVGDPAAAARVPPSFGDLNAAPAPSQSALGGITEWAGRVRDFRSSGGV